MLLDFWQALVRSMPATQKSKGQPLPAATCALSSRCSAKRARPGQRRRLACPKEAGLWALGVQGVATRQLSKAAFESLKRLPAGSLALPSLARSSTLLGAASEGWCAAAEPRLLHMRRSSAGCFAACQSCRRARLLCARCWACLLSGCEAVAQSAQLQAPALQRSKPAAWGAKLICWH